MREARPASEQYALAFVGEGVAGRWLCGFLARRTWDVHRLLLVLQPARQHVDDVLGLQRRQRLAHADAMPFFQTGTTAGRGRVLRHEYRVTAKRRLLAVLVGMCGRQPRGDETLGMLQHFFQTVLLQVAIFGRFQYEAAAKGGMLQTIDNQVLWEHGVGWSWRHLIIAFRKSRHSRRTLIALWDNALFNAPAVP